MDSFWTSEDLAAFKHRWMTLTLLGRWVEQHWLEWGEYEDVREFASNQPGGRGWAIPDYERGRSRLILITDDAVASANAEQIQKALEGADWLKRIEDSGLVVAPGADDLTVGPWEGYAEEQWFEDPKVGHFVVYRKSVGGVGVGYIPDPPRDIVVLDAGHWVGVGPSDVRDPATYTIADLRPFLPGED